MRKVVHIYRKGDEDEHIESLKCPCQPQISMHCGMILIYHISYDGREAFDELRELVENMN